MSFGFSVGDFLATARVIKDIVTALRNSSASSYRELVLELDGLQRALDGVEHLKCSPNQQTALNGIKVAALVCQHPLEEFAKKLKKFEQYGGLDQIVGNRSKMDKLKVLGRKLQWRFSMEEEVMKLRAYVAAHVGSINMRLLTLGLAAASVNAEKTEETEVDLQNSVSKISADLTELREDMRGSLIISAQNPILKRAIDVLTGGFSSQLKSILDMATKIWNSNMQIMTAVTMNQNATPHPDLRHTWYQEPVRLEDALGRILPIPSEYGWSKVEAIILDHFKSGPGSEKVKAGEYLLLSALDSSQIITPSDSQGLMPGMNIMMALIIGRYGSKSSNRCQRIGCNSTKVERHTAGGYACLACRSRFSFTSHKLPTPLRPDLYSRPAATRPSMGQSGMVFGDSFHKPLREGQYFKNVTVCFTPLPPTPPVLNVRKRGHESSLSNPSKRKRTTERSDALRARRPISSYYEGWSDTKTLLTLERCRNSLDLMDFNILSPRDPPHSGIESHLHRTSGTTSLENFQPSNQSTENSNVSWVIELKQSTHTITGTPQVPISGKKPEKRKRETDADIEHAILKKPMRRGLRENLVDKDSLRFNPDQSRTEPGFALTASTGIESSNKPRLTAIETESSVQVDHDPIEVFLPANQYQFETRLKDFQEAIDPLVAWISNIDSIPQMDTIDEFTPSSSQPFSEYAASVISEPRWVQERISRAPPSVGSIQTAPTVFSDSRRKRSIGIHGITAIRACLRCKYLKRTCDINDPCSGCAPSSARLWTVPCTRLDVRHLGYFLNGENSVFNTIPNSFVSRKLKFAASILRPDPYFHHRSLHIDHGLGASLEVAVGNNLLSNNPSSFTIDAEDFRVTWTEAVSGTIRLFSALTEPLSCSGMGTVRREHLAKYVSATLELEPYGIPGACFSDRRSSVLYPQMLLAMVHTLHRRTRGDSLRKPLELVVAYNLSRRVAFTNDLGLGSEPLVHGGTVDFGKHNIAPALVLHAVSLKLTTYCSELHTEVLEDLSRLYSGVYGGERLKNYVTIFAISLTLMVLWEWMEFDIQHLSDDTEESVQKFKTALEGVPLQVLTGLLKAISQKIPPLREWETSKHHRLLHSDPAACDFMTELGAFVKSHQSLLEKRVQEAPYDPNEKSCFFGKFVGKILLRTS